MWGIIADMAYCVLSAANVYIKKKKRSWNEIVTRHSNNVLVSCVGVMQYPAANASMICSALCPFGNTHTLGSLLQQQKQAKPDGYAHTHSGRTIKIKTKKKWFHSVWDVWASSDRLMLENVILLRFILSLRNVILYSNWWNSQKMFVVKNVR